LKLIDRGMNVEEEAVMSFSKHISAAVDWCGCEPDEIKRAKDILTLLGRDSAGHKKVLENLREKILSSDRTEY